jgi:hypothetical protein
MALVLNTLGQFVEFLTGSKPLRTTDGQPLPGYPADLAELATRTQEILTIYKIGLTQENGPLDPRARSRQERTGVGRMAVTLDAAMAPHEIKRLRDDPSLEGLIALRYEVERAHGAPVYISSMAATAESGATRTASQSSVGDYTIASDSGSTADILAGFKALGMADTQDGTAVAASLVAAFYSSTVYHTLIETTPAIAAFIAASAVGIQAGEPAAAAGHSLRKLIFHAANAEGQRRIMDFESRAIAEDPTVSWTECLACRAE